jgi:hypothetical protein
VLLLLQLRLLLLLPLLLPLLIISVPLAAAKALHNSTREAHTQKSV